MKCHYEVLEVTKYASDDDIKKAYRKLALKWHPDKNLDNIEEAKEQFQLIQQAWETLSDSHERAWYDNHREAILKGGIGENYKDASINLFPYFSATCFKGYGDDTNGFYTIYRNVFEKLAAEDAEFAKDDESDEEIPSFGDSQSSYEDVVHNFYAYWQSYNTKKSYTWLDPYDTRNMSRRIYRMAEKENKRVREKAKHERNEQVRNLVDFIRKRDKRVHAYAAKLTQRARENSRKVEERRKIQLLERQKLLHEHNESEWSKFSNIETELKTIEKNLTKEFEADNKQNDALYCIVCYKIFKTPQAFMNHENSRKHKESVNTVKHFMLDNNKIYNNIFQDNSESQNTASSVLINETTLATDSQMPDFLLNPPQSDSKQLNDENNEDISPEELMSDDENLESNTKKKKKKINNENVPTIVTPQMESISSLIEMESKEEDVTSEDELISDQEEESPIAKKSDHKKNKKNKKRNVQNPDPIFEHVNDNDIDINEEMWLSKKQRKKLQQRKVIIIKQLQKDEKIHKEEKQETEDETKMLKETNIINEKLKVDKTKKECKKEQQSKEKNKNDLADIDNLAHCCVSCSFEFPSKNKLFEHLRKTGHSVDILKLQSKKNQAEKEKASKEKNSLSKAKNKKKC